MSMKIWIAVLVAMLLVVGLAATASATDWLLYSNDGGTQARNSPGDVAQVFSTYGSTAGLYENPPENTWITDVWVRASFSQGANVTFTVYSWTGTYGGTIGGTALGTATYNGVTAGDTWWQIHLDTLQLWSSANMGYLWRLYATGSSPVVTIYKRNWATSTNQCFYAGASKSWSAQTKLTGLVPEPGSLLALGTGLLGFAGFVVRRRR